MFSERLDSVTLEFIISIKVLWHVPPCKSILSSSAQGTAILSISGYTAVEVKKDAEVELHCLGFYTTLVG